MHENENTLKIYVSCSKSHLSFLSNLPECIPLNFQLPCFCFSPCTLWVLITSKRDIDLTPFF